MAPTLLPGDYVLIDTWKTSSDILLGEIILFEDPDTSQRMIKRLYANASGRLPMPVLGIPVLNSQQLFVVGDNLEQSIDSRQRGAVALRNVVGVATGIVCSIDQNGRIRTERITSL